MKNIIQVYEHYKVPLNLQEHQLRVAAVAKQICDSLSIQVDSDGVISACLLHDMGNIIKFDLNRFPDFITETSLTYWEQVQKEYVDKYGNDEHIATKEIAKEIGVASMIFSYIEAIGFSRSVRNMQGNIIENKICCYADMRVGPYGVLTLTQRLEEGSKRYKGTKKWIEDLKAYDEIVQSLHEIEKQIFRDSTLRPSQITDESIFQYLGDLREVFV